MEAETPLMTTAAAAAVAPNNNNNNNAGLVSVQAVLVENGDVLEEDLEAAEETHNFLSRDFANDFEQRTWRGEDEDDESAFEEDDNDDVYSTASATAGLITRKVKRRIVSFCLCLCLCGFIALIVTGSWLAAGPSTDTATDAQIAGYALLTVAGIVLLFLLCICCLSCCSSCMNGSRGNGGGLFGGSSSVFKDEFDPDDVHQRRTRPKFIFKLWGDEFRMDLYQHELLLKGTMKNLPKPVLLELNKAMKQKREQRKIEKEALERALKDKVVAALESGEDDPLKVVRDLRKRVYVVDFLSGETSVDDFAQQITLICKVANPNQDIVVFRISSPGGYVSEYGLAASQLIRVKEAGFQTVACVDTVAASGGFMLCCVCDEICAAPFAMVGSIGVITYVPNLDRLAKETLKVDVYQFSAGKHKRTVDIFGEVTEEGKLKLKEELRIMHEEFKSHVKTQRGDKLKRDIDDVATGEAWLAVNALEFGLIDRLITSDQVLLGLSMEYDILVICEFEPPKQNGLMEMLGGDATSLPAAASQQLLRGAFRGAVGRMADLLANEHAFNLAQRTLFASNAPAQYEQQRYEMV